MQQIKPVSENSRHRAEARQAKDLPHLTDGPSKKSAAGGKAHDTALRKAS